MPQLVEAVTCHRCNAPGQIELFCQNCGLFLPDATATVERVTFTRRFFGTNILETLLFIVTLGIGWLIWFAFMASTAQSPAKRMLNVYVIDANTGRAVSPGRMWVRDVLVKILLFGFFGAIFGIVGLVDGLFVLFDKSRQSLHDKVVSTIVVYAPQGLPEAMRAQVETYAAPAMPAAPAAPVTPAPPATPAAPGATIAGSTPGAPIGETAERLRELTRLRDEGIITQEEYEQKRADLARQL